MQTARRRKLFGFLGILLGYATGLGALCLVPWFQGADGPSSGTAVLPAPGDAAKDWDQGLGVVPSFVDVAEQAGVRFQHFNGMTGKYRYLEVMGAGVALFDYDGDGFLDLYLVQGNDFFKPPSPDLRNRLYHNGGDGTFTDVTEKAGVGDAGFGQGACTADYDNDGDVDLYVSNFGPNILYRNRGDGTFEDVALAAGVADPGWGQSCSFLDYDGDGWLDLYVQNYLTYSLSVNYEAFIYIGEKKVLDYPSPRGFQGALSRLFRNKGDGTFVDVTAAAGLERSDGKGMGCACFDYDDDGHVDIFVGNDTIENFLFHNRGDGTFEEVALAAGVAYDGAGIAEASMGVDVGDHDGDGRMDITVPCVWQQVYSLYRNEGTFFTDVSFRAGLAGPTAPLTGFSPNFIDYDNDGDLDLFYSNGGVRMNELSDADGSYEDRYGLPDLLLANDGRGHYTDISSRAGEHFLRRLIGRGSAVGDLDNDGDLDIVLSNLAGPAVILRNDTPSRNHWVTLLLQPRRGSRDALGTSVWCQAGGVRRRAVVHGGVSYLSQNDRRVHFGLGGAERIDRLEILWPDRERQVIENLSVDAFISIRQGEEPSR